MWVYDTSLLHKVDEDEGYHFNLLFKMDETSPNIAKENCPLVDRSTNERVMKECRYTITTMLDVG